jgi:hypothetical protein
MKKHGIGDDFIFMCSNGHNQFTQAEVFRTHRLYARRETITDIG